MPAKGFQTCRRCEQKKPISQFPTKGRDFMSCLEEGPTGNLTHRGDYDPFRRGVDIKGLDKFLRQPLINLGEHRVKRDQ